MLRNVYLLIPLLWLSACTQKPSTDYLAGQDYSAYQSYAFAPLTEEQSLDGQRIEQALSSALAAEGLRLESRENADLWVRYRVEERRELQARGGSVGVGFGVGSNSSLGMSTPVNYQERRFGKLRVEFIEQAQQRVVWSALSGSQISESTSPGKREAFIQKQIDLMLENYPPAN